jgi:dTDP-glucose pyrophosphorylase
MSANTLPATATLLDAIQVIESTTKRLAVVLSDDNTVLGTVTDGDIRRRILQGYNLHTKVVDAMNCTPVIAEVNMSDSVIRKLLVDNIIRSLPQVDNNGQYIKTLHESELLDEQVVVEKGEIFSAAIIMAGGEGTRLGSLTKNMPKPMVDINGLPLLERQIHRLQKMGILVVYISVNYLSEVIKEYFGNGSQFGVKINYLEESKKLGTAGALSLLPDFKDSRPVLVINGDVLTTSDFINLFHFHEDHKAAITICAVDYHIEIPYGVIKYNGTKVKSLQEKPSQQFFCNAGMYALSIDTLQKIPENTFWNMTDLIDQCLAAEETVSVFPVHEYWSDIGTPADLEKARKDFAGA